MDKNNININDPMFKTININNEDILKIREDIDLLIYNNVNLANLISNLDKINKLNIKPIEKNKQAIELLSNNENLLDSNIFLNYYYWITDLALNNLLCFNVYNYKNVHNLIKNISPLIKNNLKIYKQCSQCKKKIVEYVLPSSRTDMKFISSQDIICDCCKEKNKKIEEEKEKIRQENEKINKKEIENQIEMLNGNCLSSNIIITKYQDNFYIDFENGEILSNISNEFIEVINKLFIIDKSMVFSKDKNKKTFNLLKNNKDIISNYLFIAIYKYFTDLRLDNIYDFFKSEAINETTSKLIIKIIDGNNITYENPITRTSSMLKIYSQFPAWLCDKSSETFTFNNLFLENKFDGTIIESEFFNEKEDINKLKSMPYKEYLQTEHWKQTRGKALKKANYRCELCNSKIDLNVHHKTYENRGEEKPNDLIVLCHNCHSKFHDKLEESGDEVDNIDNNTTKYLETISFNALKEKVSELNKLFGFEFIKDIHIDFSDLQNT